MNLFPQGQVGNRLYKHLTCLFLNEIHDKNDQDKQNGLTVMYEEHLDILLVVVGETEGKSFTGQ